MPNLTARPDIGASEDRQEGEALKVLAILQNQWFKDPDKVRAIYARRPELRNDLIARFLFMGCLTGRRLRTAFGEETCSRIVWEEASPEVGGKSSALFRADVEHVKSAIEKHRPDVVVAFGAEATRAVKQAWSGPAVYGPHPAARYPDITARLRACADEFRSLERAA